MLKLQDRVKELTTTSGTGTLTLSGTAEAGFQAFSVLGNGTKTYYTISDVNGTDFEIGLGTYSSNTLTRDTIFESSNSGNAISLSATGSTVFVTYPAEKSSYRDIGVNRDYTASGSITAGKPLILNADNTVTQVAESGNTVTEGMGLNQVVDSSGFYDGMSSLCWIDEANGKFAVGYLASNGYPTAVIGTVDGSNKTITYGSPFSLSTSYTNTKSPSIAYDPDQSKLFMTFNNVSDALAYGRFLSVSGTTITAVGNMTVMDSDQSYYQKVMYDTVNNVMLFLNINSTGQRLEWCGVTMTGTTPSRNSATQQALTQSNIFMKNGLSYDSTNGIFYFALNVSNNNNIMQGAKWNGSAFSIGTASAITTASNDYNNEATSWFGTGYKFAHFYASSSQLYGTVVTVDSSTLNITNSTYQAIGTINNANGTAVSYDSASGKFSLMASGSSIGVTTVISLSGTTFTAGDSVTFLSSASSSRSHSLPTSDTSQTENPTVFGYNDTSVTDGVCRVFTQGQSPVTNLTTDNYFGIASSTASTTEPVGVNRAGSFNNDQTGMTAGKDMYVTDAGLIKERTTTTTTPDTNPTVSTVSQQNSGGYSYYNNCIAYESTSGYYVRGRKESTNNYACVESGTWGSLTTGITWNTPTILYSHIMRGQFVNVTTGGGYAHLAYCTRENSNDNAKVTPVAISGSGSLSLGTTTTVNVTATSSSNVQPVGIEYDTSQNTILAFFYLGWQSGYINKVFPLQMSGANYSYSSSDAVTLTSGIDVDPIKSINTIFDPNTNRTIFFYNKNDVTETINGFLLSCSGTTITQHATQTPSLSTPTSSCWTNVAYDTQNNKIIFMYYVNSPVNYAPKYSIVTVTGGATNTLSFTSDEYVFANTSQQAQASTLAWNGDANKLFMLYPAYIGGNIQCNTFTSNGSTLTTITEAEILTEDMSDSGGNETRASVFVSNQGISYSLGDPNNSPGIINFTLSLGSTTSTVVNGSQFVGTARSGTDLELSEPPTELVAMANGSITKGKPVILRTDGDFAEVGGTNSSGSVVSPETQQISGQQNTEDKFYIADNGNGIFAVVSIASNRARIILGEDTGTSITWGSEVTLDDTSENITGVSVYYDSEEDKFIATNVSGGSQNVCSYIVSYSGTTATKGTQSSLLALGYPNSNYVLASDYNTTDKKGIVCIGKDTGKLFTVTVSGTTITQSALSSQFSGSSNSAQFFNMVYDNTNSVGYITYRNEAISDYPYIQTFTVSGDTFSFGTETVIQSLSADGYVGVAEGSADGKGVCVAWRRSGTGINYIAPTFSGLVPTIGSVTTLSGGQVPDTSLYWEGAQVVNYNPVSQSFILAYQDTSGKYDIITNNGTVSGSTLTFSDYDVVYPQTNASQYYAISNPTGKNANNVFIIQQRYNQSPYKTAGSIWGASYSNSTTNLTSTNFIGFAQNTVADNEDVKVKVISQSDENQTGLTTASQYYVQTDGTLSTTAGTPSVLGGTALSSTKILIKS